MRLVIPTGPWWIVGMLSMTVTVSYGVLMYALPVMLAPMQAELGWSPALLTAGFSAAALASGVASIPVGHWIDRYGPRRVMTTGSVTATILLLAWSRVHEPAMYLLVWIGLGAAMAAVFYEPAFAVIAGRFQTKRARALSILTLAGGLASTIFVPLTSWLVGSGDWRTAVVWLAVLLAALTIVPHALLPRTTSPRRADDDTAARVAAVTSCALATSRGAVRSAQFRWLAAAFFLSTIANFAVTVHLIPLLLERGFSASLAAGALALLGLAKLPGRALIAPLASRSSARMAVVAVLLLQIVGLIALGLLEDAVGTWLFIALFGAGDGAATPARGELIAELFGSAEYGRIGGVLGFILAVARFVAPAGTSLLYAVLGGYAGVLWALGFILAAAAFAMVRVAPTALRAVRAACDDDAASFCGVCRLPV